MIVVIIINIIRFDVLSEGRLKWPIVFLCFHLIRLMNNNNDYNYHEWLRKWIRNIFSKNSQICPVCYISVYERTYKLTHTHYVLHFATAFNVLFLFHELPSCKYNTVHTKKQCYFCLWWSFKIFGHVRVREYRIYYGLHSCMSRGCTAARLAVAQLHVSLLALHGDVL